jgi:hypothetical protein
MCSREDPKLRGSVESGVPSLDAVRGARRVDSSKRAVGGKFLPVRRIISRRPSSASTGSGEPHPGQHRYETDEPCHRHDRKTPLPKIHGEQTGLRACRFPKEDPLGAQNGDELLLVVGSYSALRVPL